MADTSVKYFHGAMPGAPVLSGTAGALINVLDACLVNGFGVSAVASLVVAGEVATATISGGHSGEVGSVMTVAGATPSGLNGEKKVLSVGGGNTTLTFDATGIADQTATGSITIKVSGAGWVKAFSGTNLAAYQSGDVAATGCYLRVDDTAGKTARVLGYRTMTGVSSGDYFEMTSGGAWWTKSTVSDGSARPWTLVADDRTAYLLVAYHPSYGAGAQFVCWGDLESVKSGDAWQFMVSGYDSDASGLVPGSLNDFAVLRNTAAQLTIAKSYTAVGAAVAAYCAFPLLVPSTSVGFASGAGPMPYPNGPDSGLYLTPLHVFEANYHALRGTAPGLWCCPQTLPRGLFAAGARISAADNLLDKDLRVVPFGTATGTAAFAFFDTAGPWR